MKYLQLPIYVILSIFFSCSTSERGKSDATDTPESTTSEPASTIQQVQEEMPEAAATEEPSASELLLGKWQSLDDPSSGLEFTSDQRISIYAGERTSQDNYVLAGNCESTGNESTTDDPKYLSLPDDDMCFYIIQLDDARLELSYVGRGNTLRYYKVPYSSSADFPYVKGRILDIVETAAYGLFLIKIVSGNDTLTYEYEEFPGLFNQLYDWRDSQAEVRVGYERTEMVSAVDLLFTNEMGEWESIEGEYGGVTKNGGEIDPSWEKVEGILKAEYESGDTPSPYSVTTSDGQEYVFEAFVWQKYLDLSGSTVTVYTTKYVQDEVKDIRVVRSDEEQIAFIREVFGLVTEAQAAGEDQKYEFEIGDGGGFLQYERSTVGNRNSSEAYTHLSVADCSDHGCDKTSYYFYYDELIFSFREEGYGVLHEDQLTETRTYYRDEFPISCLYKTYKGTEGQEAVTEKLASLPNEEIPCEPQYSVSQIKEMLQLNKGNAAAYFWN